LGTTIYISFQLPKLAFFQPELQDFVGNWDVVNIGLDQSFIEKQKTNFFVLEPSDVKDLVPPRTKFSHKGDFGKIQLVSGSKGKMGAAAMAGKAALRSGTGLLFYHIPGCGVDIIQQLVPEGMVQWDKMQDHISRIEFLQEIDAVGIGPGMGTSRETSEALGTFLKELSKDQCVVVDADAINILAANPDLVTHLPQDSILTPHPGEFRRMVGEWKNDYEKLELLKSTFIKSRSLRSAPAKFTF